MGLGGQSKHSLGQDNVTQLQAMRDLVTPATLAIEHKGDLEAQGIEKQSWRDVALAFWQSTVRDDEETRAKIRKKKLHRTKAYEWLLAVSHMVLIATGSQLTRYQQVEDKAGWSACHWLIHLRHNILLLHDWCHRVCEQRRVGHC